MSSFNGKAMLFYSQRPKPHVLSQKKRKRKSSQKATSQADSVIDDIQHGLTQLGITDVTEKQIKVAVAETHPDGHAGVPTAVEQSEATWRNSPSGFRLPIRRRSTCRGSRSRI